MDPLVWTTIAEFWWLGPAVIGTGTAGWLGWLGLRHQRSERARRLAHEAAKHELRIARQRSVAARGAARVARADLARVQAERTASHATAADVAAARLELQSAQREAHAATAAVRAGRARVTAARAALSHAARGASATEELPLARLTAAHDAVTARWMEYETDAARVLAFPAMSDGRQPLTAAYLTVRAEASSLRPTPAQVARSQVTAAQFAAYRDAVQRLERAFDAAEKEAWRQARAAGTAPAGASAPPRSTTGDAPAEPGSAPWSVLAQTAVARSTEALTRAAEAAASALDARLASADGRRPSPFPQAAPRPPAHDQDRGPTDSEAAGDPESAGEPRQRPGSTSGPEPVWPVPARSRTRPPTTEG
ncbi:hypothetical protein [Microbacterium sp. PA5]|uniref:hypothetical protein n=1 Tax=Microbacterium sp. PA5 TaxID=3416654 RepID=UPI003CF9CAEC